MRILQVVTYISPDGEYGGPVRVALNQAKALRGQGHDVIVAAAAGGFDGVLPQVFDGFPVRLFPARWLVPKIGFAGLASPGLMKWLCKEMKEVDVVHIHMARDFVTLPSAVLALLLHKPLVLQTHGMIDATKKLLAQPLDLVITKPVLRRANTVLYLTKKERSNLEGVAGPLRKLKPLPNGVIVNGETVSEIEYDREGEPEVLFLARLHKRKRPVTFVNVAEALLRAGLQASFRIVGPDEGEAESVKNAIDSSKFPGKITYEGPLKPHETQERLAKCDIYVLPAINEPFPMSVIEAMAAGKPVIITKTCGLAKQVRIAKAGLVIDHEEKSLEWAIKMTVQDRAERRAMGSRAKILVSKDFDIDVVARELLEAYAEAAKHDVQA